MAAFEWWNFDDTVKLAPASEGGIGFIFEDVAGGIATAVQEWHFHNKSGQDEEGLTLQVLCRKISSDNFVLANEEFVENGYLQTRIKGDSFWQSMGPNSELLIPFLADDTFTAIEARIVSNDDTQVAAYQVKVRVNRKPYISIGQGHFETVGNGVISGLGDTSRSFLVDFSNVLEDPGGASDNVFVPKIFGSIKGKVGALVEDLVNVGLNDFDGNPPVAAEKFYFAVVFDGEAISIIKGINDDDPIKPVVLSGFILAWGKQSATGDIVNGDIENVWYLDRFAITISGLNVTVHHGIGHINNHLVTHNKTSTFALTDNSENYLSIRSDRGFELTVDGSVDEERQMLLYEFTALVGVIVDKRDRRRFVGTEILTIQTTLSGAPILVNDVSYSHYYAQRLAYISSITFNTIDGTGAGDTKVDINKSVEGGAFSSIFGDQALRPKIDGGDNYDLNGWPTERIIDKNTIFEFVVDSVPATTSPTNIFITMILECP